MGQVSGARNLTCHVQTKYGHMHIHKCISCSSVSDTEPITRKNPIQRLMSNEAKQLMC